MLRKPVIDVVFNLTVGALVFSWASANEGTFGAMKRIRPAFIPSPTAQAFIRLVPVFPVRLSTWQGHNHLLRKDGASLLPNRNWTSLISPRTPRQRRPAEHRGILPDGLDSKHPAFRPDPHPIRIARRCIAYRQRQTTSVDR